MDIAVMREDRRRTRRQASSHVLISESLSLCYWDVPDSAIRGEQIDHPKVAVHDGDEHGVSGAFDFRVRVSAMLQEELRNLIVPVVHSRIERVAVRRDALFGEIRIGSAIEE